MVCIFASASVASAQDSPYTDFRSAFENGNWTESEMAFVKAFGLTQDELKLWQEGLIAEHANEKQITNDKFTQVLASVRQRAPANVHDSELQNGPIVILAEAHIKNEKSFQHAIHTLDAWFSHLWSTPDFCLGSACALVYHAFGNLLAAEDSRAWALKVSVHEGDRFPSLVCLRRRLQVTVVDAVTNVPVSDADVSFEEYDSPHSSASGGGVTNAQGSTSLSVDLTAAISINVVADGYYHFGGKAEVDSEGNCLIKLTPIEKVFRLKK